MTVLVLACMRLLCSLVVTTISGTQAWFLGQHSIRNVQPSRTAATTPNNEDVDDISDATAPAETASILRSVTFGPIPKDEEPGVLADFLVELGACSAAVTDADAGTDVEIPLFAEPMSTSTDTAWYDSLHWAAPLWNQCHVTAHFGASTDLEGIVRVVQTTFPDVLGKTPAVQVLPDRDWVVHVQSSWKPIAVESDSGWFILRFPWHTDDDVRAAVVQAERNNQNDHSKAIELALQGGIAFGTGEHATTQLCLQWLDETLSSNHNHSVRQPTSFRVLDYGSGSGILGLAAAKLLQEEPQSDMYDVKVIGVDIDVDACHIANQNAVTNDVNMHNYLPPLWLETADEASKALWLQAHARVEQQQGDTISANQTSVLWPKAESTDNFDVCVANILATPLITLAPTLYSMVRPGAPVGMSGILEHQGEDVMQAFANAGFVDMKVARELDGWVLVTGRRQYE